MEDLLQNIGAHFSRSFSRQETLKEYQTFLRVDIHKILLPAHTRWLSLKACVLLTELLFSDPSKTTQSTFSAFANKFSKIYLYFINYTLELLTDFNTLSQSKIPLLHRLKPEVESILKTLCCNSLRFDSVQSQNIFALNHKNSDLFTSPNNIYVRVQAAQAISEIKNKCDANERNLFYKNCQMFYLELVSDIKHRFYFTDDIFNFIDMGEPLKAQAFTMKILVPVLNRFPFVKTIINEQALDNEWRKHATMNHSVRDSTVDVEEYWRQVFAIKNASGIEVFLLLKIVINLLLILPFSNASVECIFSQVNGIKTDTRNCLGTCTTLSALLHTKQGIKCAGGIVAFEPIKEMYQANIWTKLNYE